MNPKTDTIDISVLYTSIILYTHAGLAIASIMAPHVRTHSCFHSVSCVAVSAFSYSSTLPHICIDYYYSLLLSSLLYVIQRQIDNSWQTYHYQLWLCNLRLLYMSSIEVVASLMPANMRIDIQSSNFDFISIYSDCWFLHICYESAVSIAHFWWKRKFSTTIQNTLLFLLFCSDGSFCVVCDFEAK